TKLFCLLSSLYLFSETKIAVFLTLSPNIPIDQGYPHLSVRSRTENTLAPASMFEKSPKFGRLKLSRIALLLRSLRSATMRTPPEGFGRTEIGNP
ncbi:hypothetical protein Avbf_14373, partial [Armadillidium vulgare]